MSTRRPHNVVGKSSSTDRAQFRYQSFRIPLHLTSSHNHWPYFLLITPSLVLQNCYYQERCCYLIITPVNKYDQYSRFRCRLSGNFDGWFGGEPHFYPNQIPPI